MRQPPAADGIASFPGMYSCFMYVMLEFHSFKWGNTAYFEVEYLLNIIVKDDVVQVKKQVTLFTKDRNAILNSSFLCIWKIAALWCHFLYVLIYYETRLLHILAFQMASNVHVIRKQHSLLSHLNYVSYTVRWNMYAMRLCSSKVNMTV